MPREDTVEPRCTLHRQNRHEMVVRLLLDRGADVHAQGGYHGTALQAASMRGCQAIQQLLLGQISLDQARGRPLLCRL
jgi:hypothetical protein